MYFTSSCLRWLETVLEERYGFCLELRLIANRLQLRLPGTEGTISFDTLQPEFHLSRSDFPCGCWNANTEGFISALEEPLPTPGMAIMPTQIVEHVGLDAVVHYDILGLTYWMLSRLEEVGRTDLDNHGRFPAYSSHAYLHGYLERPIVDEWLHLLGQIIQRVWPKVQLKQHDFSIKVSHDVDSPSLYAFKPWKTICRMMAGHLLKRRDFKAMVQAPWVKLHSYKSIAKQDPYYTFDWLMDVSEANDLKSAFYFICGGDHANDADYQLEDLRIRQLMRHIHERGHEIGLHPSYRTYKNPELVWHEAERLKRICAEEGIEQAEWGGRMHYLRWEQPTTLRACADAGMSYDATLGYADKPGFRCGTCHEYPAIDPVTHNQLNLRIRPLIVMECTVMSDLYLGLGITGVAAEKMSLLKKRCRLMGGSFSMLWHNSYFEMTKLKSIYQYVLSK